MITNFCEKAQKIIAVAESIAFDFGHSSVGSEHLLLAFLKVKDTKVKKLLENFNITYDVIKKDLLNLFERKNELPFYMEYTPSFKEILEKAIRESKKLNEERVGVEVLASSMINQEDSLARELLEKYHCDFKFLLENLKVSKVSPLDNIEELTNLNKKFQKKPVIVYQRDAELDLITNALLRKQKANVMLVGEPGVGKSALIEYLAYKITLGEVMDELKEKVIYELDIPSIVAGTKYRGEFEEKLKKIIKKVKEDKNAIIFIDEIHNIIGAGGAEGAIDASNILKPYLARGELKCIGATTYDEYVKLIEKEKAVDRRFQLIKLDEPNMEKCYEILKGIKEDYENFHKIKISDEMCKKIISLSKKYIADRYFPDKAIDVLDCSSVLARKKNLTTLDESTIVETIETLFNVEINSHLDKAELQNSLNRKIVGQNDAICKIIEHLSYIEKGLIDDNRPLGTFLFVGPSGVGKTELAKKIAKYYFGNEEAYIKIDMTEFKEPQSISKLIGAAPGYIGYDNQTMLIDKLRMNPHSVVILDEIEKAHKDVINVFLNVFDEGYFYDAKKRKIDFTNSIIIMTSNLGSGSENKTIGFLPQTSNHEEVIKSVNKFFSVEFMNRIDEIICFNCLDKKSAGEIASNYLKEYQNKLKFEVDEENFIKDVVENKDVEKYGARYIKRELKKKMLKVLENRIEVY